MSDFDAILQTAQDALLESAAKKLVAGELMTTEEANAHFASSLQNPVNQVYFRAGLIACREFMARFVEAESPSIAASIRANWWPRLGDDLGPPRLMDWSELTEGGDEGPWTEKTITPTLEALPIALQFLSSPSDQVQS
jgi:hypothetical protein